MQEGVITIEVERQVDSGRDTAGQILQSLQQIGLVLDMRSVPDQLLGFGNGVEQRL